MNQNRSAALRSNALDVARAEFRAQLERPRRPELDGSAVPGWPAGPIRLDHVRDLLLTRSCRQRVRDQVWVLLVQHARDGDPAWTIGAVGVALPGLTATANRLTARFAGDPSDICSEILAGFLFALQTVDVDRPRVMVRLRWAAYRAGHAALLGALRTPTPVDVLPDGPGLSAAGGHPDLVLDRAVTDGVITAREADLIGATRLGGGQVTAWAAANATGGWAAYKARRRAELRLRTYLLDDGAGDDRLLPARRAVADLGAGRSAAAAGSNCGGAGGVQHDPPARASEDPQWA